MDKYYTVAIPRKIVELVRERGLDLEILIVDALIEILKVDPNEEVALRIEVAEHFFEEAKKYIEVGDAVQASEKLYKVVEECIKALAQYYRIPELSEVIKRGRWDTWILGKAAARLALQLGEERIRTAWAYAYEIHVWGFHETKYGIDIVKQTLPYIEWLLQYTKKILK